ncbi:hypothetical protein [Hymenobacter sp. DG25B]|uniref:hypothetical protein n=1 Tax=Hymenobacter sp. DG25B TaxID=1385664 RepID=UPI0012E07743|nr:hypothetical protein [Hymenobacter sp. DG25B]
MLANQSDSLVSQMLRNARKEQRVLVFILILNWVNVSNMFNRHLSGASLNAQLLLYGCVGLMVVFIAWTTYRKRRLLTQLQAADTSTYRHLRQTIQQIRSLIKNKKYAGMLFLVSIILAAFYIRYDSIMQALHKGTVDWGLTILLTFAAAMLIAGLLYLDQQRQQRRYGKYLDQLEATLHELKE